MEGESDCPARRDAGRPDPRHREGRRAGRFLYADSGVFRIADREQEGALLCPADGSEVAGRGGAEDEGGRPAWRGFAANPGRPLPAFPRTSAGMEIWRSIAPSVRSCEKFQGGSRERKTDCLLLLCHNLWGSISTRLTTF